MGDILLCIESGHLTPLPLDKMAAFSQMTFSTVFSWINFWILIWISLEFVPKGPIDN